MKTQFLKLTAVIAAVLLASGCGSGMKSASSGGGSGNNGGQSVAFDNLKMDGAVKEGKYEDRKLITLDKENKVLIMRLPTLALPILVGGGLNQALNIPNVPGTTVSLEVAADGNLDLVIRLPLEHLMHGATFVDAKLPNGDDLPAVPDGELPGLAVDLNLQKTVKGYLYFGKAVFGALVTSQFDPVVAMQLPIYQNNGAVLGYLTTVPAKNGFDGGLFMSVRIPADIARIIDNVL